MNYEMIGEGSQAIVFLHGWGGSREDFRKVAEKLGRGYRCYLIDLYGFGSTPHPEKPLRLIDYTRGVRCIVNKEKLDKVVLVGHSFGGRIAINYCVNFPEVEKLVLVDSAGLKPRRKLPYYLKKINYKLRKRLKLSTENCGSSDYKLLGSNIRRTFVNVVNYHQNKEVSLISENTLILWGSEDTETPLYMAKALHRKIKKSQLTVIDGVGHFPFIDAFLPCVNAISEFLAEEKDAVLARK